MLMLPGCSLPVVRDVWMNKHNVTVTQLDRGNYIPDVVYCIAPFCRVRTEDENEKWIEQLWTKIGMANSIYNRIRLFNQNGIDNRLLWTIETHNKSFVETLVHNYLHEYHDNTAHRTELFDFDSSEAFDILDQMTRDLQLDKIEEVISITKYDANGVIGSSKKSTAKQSAIQFNNLFAYS